MNTLFRNALARIPQNIPPIWFMRQAGRYHHHYRSLKSKYSFMELCKQPELAAQVALGPVLEFDFDVSILFSDLLFTLEALGMGLKYTDHHGPQLDFSLDHQTIYRLGPVDKAIEFMSFQKEAMRATRNLLPAHKSLIGFVGGPWTLFVYAVEGAHTGSLIKSKSLIHLFPLFVEKMYPLLKANIRLQIEGGAEVVMIFDTAAGEVSPLFFQEWIQPVLSRLAQGEPEKIGYYSKNTHREFFNKSFTKLPWAGQGFDHRHFLTDLLKTQDKGFVQGNFDQSLLFMNEDDLKKALHSFLAPLKNTTPQERAGWVCGLGHGVLPQTPEKNIRLFIETVRKELAS